MEHNQTQSSSQTLSIQPYMNAPKRLSPRWKNSAFLYDGGWRKEYDRLLSCTFRLKMVGFCADRGRHWAVLTVLDGPMGLYGQIEVIFDYLIELDSRWQHLNVERARFTGMNPDGTFPDDPKLGW